MVKDSDYLYIGLGLGALYLLTKTTDWLYSKSDKGTLNASYVVAPFPTVAVDYLKNPTLLSTLLMPLPTMVYGWFKK